MKLTVDRDRCCSSGQCARIAPDLFDQSDEDGTAVLLAEHPPAERAAAARLAVAHCPSGALELTLDANTVASETN